MTFLHVASSLGVPPLAASPAVPASFLAVLIGINGSELILYFAQALTVRDAVTSSFLGPHLRSGKECCSDGSDEQSSRTSAFDA